MPSWNIHIAHVERLLDGRRAERLGIVDENAFLFGNFVPDVYVGFMVPDATMRVDYRLTHLAKGNLIPVPNADLFWDAYLARPRPMDDSVRSLTLGAWAHLMTDRFYNGNFRTFWRQHEVPEGEELRIRKQADFDLFGHELGISRCVEPTAELYAAAEKFGPYRVLEADVARAIAVGKRIVREAAQRPTGAAGDYQLLSAAWLEGVFAECDERLGAWLSAWQRLVARGADVKAADVRAEAGLPDATPDDPDWMHAR